MEQNSSREAYSHWASQEIPHPALYLSQRFITMFTRAHHWSLSWARCIPSHAFPP